MSKLSHITFRSSLAGRALFRIAIRVAIIIVLMTAVSYFHVVSTVQEQSLSQLEKYIVERTEREGTIFRLAEDNHKHLKVELLQRLQALGDTDPVEAFNEEVVKFPDGTWRTRLEGFDGSRESFVFIGKQAKIDADLRRRVMTFIELSNQYGPAWHHRLQNVYFTAPENLLAGYWPEVPDWAHSLPADIYMPDEEYVWAADKQHNPSRESVWTGLFYDVGSNVWMASLETPVDIGDRQIATIGHDLTLNELFERTRNDHLEDSYNLIIRQDGHLIAHPEMMESLKSKQGNLNIADSDNAHLKSIYQKIKNKKSEGVILEHKEFSEYLAVGTIEETGWHFVTVYPRSLITVPAFETASIVLFLGLLSLIIELFIFYIVLSRGVSKPLHEFSGAVSLVAEGQLDMRLDARRDDELGVLGGVFNHMTQSLQQREEQSRFNAELGSAMTRALSNYVTDQESVRNNFKQMLSDILLVTDSEYGFIGEIHHKDGVRFLKTHAISDIAWDEESRKLYKEYADEGMEFHNLDALFGAVITSQDVVISNDPANDERGTGLPEGHPPLNSFLGVPLMLGGNMIGMVGIANRPYGYDMALVDGLNPLFHTCASVIDAFRKDREFKRIKDAIRQQAKVIDQIHDAVISTDLEGIITSWNEGATKLFEYTKEEMLGKNITVVYPKELHAFLRDQVIAPLQAKGEHEVEVRMLKKSNKDFFAHLSLSMLYDEHKSPIGMIGYTMDISERKKAEEALRESEERFRTINSRVPGIVYQFKVDTKGKRSLPYVSPTVEKYLGLTDEIVMQDAERWFELTHPDDLPGLEHSIIESMQQLTQWNWEGRFIKSNGQICWLHGSSTPEKLPNGDVVWDGVFTDIGDRKKVEEALKESELMLEKAQQIAQIGHWKLNSKSGEVQGSDELFQIFGLEREEATLDSFVEVVHPDDREMDVAAIQRGAEYGESWDIEHRVVCRDGTEKWVHAIGEANTDYEGNVFELIGTVQDITERKHADAELSKYHDHLEELVEERTVDMQIARDVAEHANAAKSEFLSRMSHELRTPLNAILGFEQLLRNNPEEPLTEMQADNISEIQQAGKHLLVLVNEVLDLSRIESGLMDVNIESVPIVPMIETCLSQLQPLAAQRHIAIEFSFNKTCEVKADRTRLTQVLLNLLSNAIKYNSEGGQIQISCGPGNQQCLRVNVHDTGSGISEDQISRLFQPFERLETNGKVIEGTGIGLAVAKKLIEAMDGEIGVDSEPGKGSNFWFELPIGDSVNNRSEFDSEDGGDTSAPNDNKFKLLYVEDNLANLRLVEKIIQSRDDMELIEAMNAEEGLAMVAEQTPDLILLDINLPGMDGFEALRLLKSDINTRSIPVIAITANAMAHDVERGRNAGFAAYITKPINIAELLLTLDRNLPIGTKNKK